MTAGDEAGRGDRIHLFTLPEANALLPKVVPLLRQVSECKVGLEAVHDALLRISPKERSNGHRLEAVGLEHQMERLVDCLARGVRDLELLGVVVKDIEEGIIDFPSLFHGRVIFLCFRLGEDEIAFWHEVSTGFSGRRPVSELDD